MLHADLCIVGAGSGGLSVAAGAAQMGAAVVLVEKGRMGGDCLNAGCVPSKALIAAAQAAQDARRAGRFGVRVGEPVVDFGAVHAHVHGVIAAIAPHDSEERFAGLGVTVIRAAGRFVDPRTLEAGGQRIRARRFVLATGARPVVPPIPGLQDCGYLTNETLFDLTAAPEHLIVIGGGAIGVEMAQAHRRLGVKTTVIEQGRILAREEPEAAAVLRARLVTEGVEIVEGIGVAAVRRDGAATVVVCADGSERRGTHLLLAAGRAPDIATLGLEAAGIAGGARGIAVDRRLRTSNRRVFAIGDVAGGPQFTHVAAHHAAVVVRNALFALPARADRAALPRVVYADPELAQVGLTEAEARAAHGAVRVLSWPLAGNDRARAEGEEDGLAKIVATKRGRILGATLVAPHAGEMIAAWCLAIERGLGLGALAGTVFPYPTLAEIGKRAAGSHFAPLLFSARTRRLVGLIQRLVP